MSIRIYDQWGNKVMRLFTMGPVEMFEEIKQFRADSSIPYFRTAEFSEIMLDTDKILKKLAGTKDSSQTIYLTASGTAAMEATVVNCFSSKDRLLIINGGTFGQRFVDICNRYNIPHDVLTLKFGEILTENQFSSYEGNKYEGLLINIHETSTGQLYNIKIVSDFCKRNHMYLVVDAIGSFLCDELHMDSSGIDAMICSSQKGFCVEPGMSIVLLSNRIHEERIIHNDINSLYFDFKIYIENLERGQTPFTPAVGICLELNKSLHYIDKLGIERHLKNISDVAQDFRKRMNLFPVSIPEYPLSNALTPLYFNEDIAYKIFEILKNKYNIMVNPTGGHLENRLLRVAHIGQITKEDNEMLCRYIELAIDVVREI